MGKQKCGIFLGQKENLTWNVFVKLVLDWEILVPEERREERILTWNYFVLREEGREIGLTVILSKRVKGRNGVGLRRICPSKRDKKRTAKQVRRRVRSRVH